MLLAPWAAELPPGPFLHALEVAPGEAVPADHGAALVTHTTDLLGHVPVRELASAVARLG